MQIQCAICCVKLSCFGLHSSSRSDLLFPTCIILTIVSVGNGTDIQVVAYRVRQLCLLMIHCNCFSISGPVTKWTLLTSEPQRIRVKRSGRTTQRKRKWMHFHLDFFPALYY